jgi:hypothetical protein
VGTGLKVVAALVRVATASDAKARTFRRFSIVCSAPLELGTIRQVRWMENKKSGFAPAAPEHHIREPVLVER